MKSGFSQLRVWSSCLVAPLWSRAPPNLTGVAVYVQVQPVAALTTMIDLPSLETDTNSPPADGMAYHNGGATPTIISAASVVAVTCSQTSPHTSRLAGTLGRARGNAPAPYVRLPASVTPPPKPVTETMSQPS